LLVFIILLERGFVKAAAAVNRLVEIDRLCPN